MRCSRRSSSEYRTYSRNTCRHRLHLARRADHLLLNIPSPRGVLPSRGLPQTLLRRSLLPLLTPTYRSRSTGELTSCAMETWLESFGTDTTTYKRARPLHAILRITAQKCSVIVRAVTWNTSARVSYPLPPVKPDISSARLIATGLPPLKNLPSCVLFLHLLHRCLRRPLHHPLLRLRLHHPLLHHRTREDASV